MDGRLLNFKAIATSTQTRISHHPRSPRRDQARRNEPFFDPGETPRITVLTLSFIRWNYVSGGNPAHFRDDLGLWVDPGEIFVEIVDFEV